MRKPACLLLLLGIMTAACGGPMVDLTKGLEVQNVSTAWLDVGIVNGKNKLVPMITFNLKNVSDQKLDNLQLNILFRRVTEPDMDWGSDFMLRPAQGGLLPGGTTANLTAKSQLGYTGTEPRETMLRNSHFVDAKIDLFAKYQSTQWAKVGEFPVDRRLVIP